MEAYDRGQHNAGVGGGEVTGGFHPVPLTVHIGPVLLGAVGYPLTGDEGESHTTLSESVVSGLGLQPSLSHRQRPEVAGSNSAPATKFRLGIYGFRA